jgi:hypothetical protein
MQIALYGWKGHIDNGRIENHHEEAEADGYQPKGMKRLFLSVDR